MVLGLGSGGRLLRSFQTPVLYWINLSLREKTMVLGCEPSFPLEKTLVARIARPHIASDLASRALASQAKPQRESESQARLHRSIFKKHAVFRIAGQHRRIFAGFFFCHFPVISEIKLMGFRIASEQNFFASLVIWGCAVRIASHIAVASRDLGH